MPIQEKEGKKKKAYPLFLLATFSFCLNILTSYYNANCSIIRNSSKILKTHIHPYDLLQQKLQF